MTADVGLEADILRVIEDTERDIGAIDLFCSNAGVGFSDTETQNATALANDPTLLVNPLFFKSENVLQGDDISFHADNFRDFP